MAAELLNYFLSMKLGQKIGKKNFLEENNSHSKLKTNKADYKTDCRNLSLESFESIESERELRPKIYFMIRVRAKSTNN
jgi:hypothetical protein